MPKYVVSKTLQKAEWNNSHIISENVVESIEKLKQEDGGDILVAGSGELVRFLLDHDLVDQLNLLVYPIVLGEGKKLFEGAQKKELKLLESNTFSTGIQSFIYQPTEKKKEQ